MTGFVFSISRKKLPDGQISKNLSSPRDKNILLSLEAKSPAYCARSAPTRGALRDRHGRWARNAMDAKPLLTNSGDADGKVVWS
jgi:hypothetical protein